MKKIFIPFILGLFGLSLVGCGAIAGYYPDADKYITGNKGYDEEKIHFRNRLGKRMCEFMDL